MYKKYLIPICILVVIIVSGYFILTVNNTAVREQVTQNLSVSAFLIVQDKSYELSILEGSSVYDVMVIARETTDFDFSGKKFSGLGFFVEEINGITGDTETEMYWTFYINDAKSNVGVSEYILNEGDVIEWKYEKSDL